MEALGKLKGGKAGGKSGILPEMVRGCGGEIVDYIMDMFHTVWMEQTVPQEWRDALLVPLPKKGDLTQCDNWRGVSLLNVVAKVFGKVIQVRLQRVAEEMLPDSQCGFRAGRGCADMIFCARQLVEKAKKYRHHGDKQGALAAWEELEQTGLGRVERTETSKGVGTQHFCEGECFGGARRHGILCKEAFKFGISLPKIICSGPQEDGETIGVTQGCKKTF